VSLIKDNLYTEKYLYSCIFFEELNYLKMGGRLTPIF
jgi:hypothetical protein